MELKFTSIINLIFGLFTFFLVATSCKGQAQESDYRKTRWGISMTQVQAAENETLLKADLDTGFLGYRGTVFSMEAQIFYLFKNDKLWKTEDLIVCDPENEKDFLLKQMLMNNGLEKRYGAPVQVKEKWINELYKSDSTKKGLAIRLGHLELYTIWESETTFIISGLNGGKDRVMLFANYVSKQDPDWMKEKR